MWKAITRGIRESLERRVCRTNVYSQPSTEDTVSSNNNNNKPSTSIKNSYLNLSKQEYNGGFCELFNLRGDNKDKKYYSNWNKCTQRKLTDVLGWSGILALGWVIFQTPCIRKHVFERHHSRKSGKRQCPYSQYHNVQVSHLLNNALSILPVTNCIANAQNDNEIIKNKEIKETRCLYESITVEEALKAAKDDFSLTHRIIMGEFELKFGVKALDEERYKEALEHFKTGAELSSPGSMFNLGVCHELGLGTPADSVKAAKYYHDAAERGHPGAMYNLAVFFAQGRGNLTKNIKKARILFTKAANLGQPEAKEALQLEKNITLRQKELQSAKLNQAKQSKTSMFRLFSPRYSSLSSSSSNNNNDDYNDTTRDKSYDNFYQNDKEDNHTQVFLNFLGIPPKSVPIRMEVVN